MRDFNDNIKILVTVIEKSKTESFILTSTDCPYNCDAEELSSALKEVMRETDYESIVNDARERKRRRELMQPI